MTDAPGRVARALANRYRIERKLGQGGMATVYLAEDLKHKRKVAIKVLKPELAAVLGEEAVTITTAVADALDYAHGTASSTATSSPKTSCCTRAARWWRTSASRWR